MTTKVGGIANLPQKIVLSKETGKYSKTDPSTNKSAVPPLPSSGKPVSKPEEDEKGLGTRTVQVMTGKPSASKPKSDEVVSDATLAEQAIDEATAAQKDLKSLMLPEFLIQVKNLKGARPLSEKAQWDSEEIREQQKLKYQRELTSNGGR